MDDQGVIVAGQYTGRSPSVFNGLGLTAASAYCQYYRVQPLRNGVEITWRPDDIEDQALFQLLTSPATVFTTLQPLPILFAQVYGAKTAGASSVYYEVAVNFEGTFLNTTILPGGSLQPSAPAEPGWFETAARFITNVEPIMPYFNKAVGAAAQYVLPSIMGASGAGRGMPRMIEL